ncbi:MAG: histidine phosphatase family protein [Chloroflexota bacterium]|nr:histidine phosphatase family protein [Chloroflexota bacterium]
MRKLVLVRHSQPEIEPGVPAAKWKLSDLGRRRAESLAAGLRHYRANAIWSSREPKAKETAQLIGHALGLPFRVTDGLEEHHRRNVPFFQSTQEFERAVEEFLSQPCRLVLGSETATQARDRVTTAIEAVLEGDNQDAIVVTHGTVMALYLARIANVEPMSFWRELETPCFVDVEIPQMRVGPIVTCGRASRSVGRRS